MRGDGSPVGPRGRALPPGDDGPGPGDVAAVDALLDRLAARRPRAEDLDDPAAAVLALLAAEVDLHPVPEDVLRRRLTDLGRWPLPSAGPSAVPAATPPPTRVLDLREAWPEEPVVARSAVRDVPQARSGAAAEQVGPAPRQVRVRLLAVVAVAAVGIWGVGLAATGASNPWRAGTIIAGTDEGSRIEHLLDDGLELVSAHDLSAGRANLENAYAWSRTADLTPDQRRRVEEGLEKLSTALSRQGVALPVALRPGTVSTKAPADGVPASPAEAPVTSAAPDADDAPAATSPAAGTPEATAAAQSPSAPGDELPSSSSTTGPVPTRTRTTGPVASESSTTRSKDGSGSRSSSPPKRTKTTKTRTEDD